MPWASCILYRLGFGKRQQQSWHFGSAKGVAYINGGSVSADGENAYGILLGWGDGMANLYIDMSIPPQLMRSIILIMKNSLVPHIFSRAFSAVLGETKTVTLTGSRLSSPHHLC